MDKLTKWIADALLGSLGPQPDKVCRQTCEECGSKLVNLYRKGNEWKCKLCWEKEGGASGK